VMLVVVGGGLPIGFQLASANRHEVKLATSTLQSVRVPRGGRGCPKQRPKELVADKAYDSSSFRGWLRSWGIKPTIPSYQRRERKRPKRGRPIETGELATRSGGRSKGPSPGWATSGGSWLVKNATSPPSGPSFWSPSSSCR
jgi:hypothetical protein